MDFDIFLDIYRWLNKYRLRKLSWGEYEIKWPHL